MYAGKKAIGPRQLNDVEAKDAARRAYQDDPKLSSAEIGKAFGRSRQAVENYIADLRATIQFKMDLSIFHMNSLGIPQDTRTIKTLRDRLF